MNLSLSPPLYTRAHAGRTGSGKSSLLAALLRLPADGELRGRVLLGGVDISTLRRGALRAAIAYVPQVRTGPCGGLCIH